MEKRVETKVSSYINKFKDDIKSKMGELKIIEEHSELLRYIFDYESINWEKEDFTRRKRVKNSVPAHDRCMALRAAGEQCTRRRKDSCQFCGTHSKGIPHGIFNGSCNEINSGKIVELIVEDIKGIMYYVDNDDNVYNQAHVLSDKVNPERIGKKIKNADGTFYVKFNH